MRKLFLILIMICGVMLTGCAQLIEINDQESDVLAEYMAGTMLRHDVNYHEALIYPNTSETAETSDMTETGELVDKGNMTETADTISNDTGESNSADVPASSGFSEEEQNGSMVSLASLFKDNFKNKFTIAYVNYKLYDSYPDEYDYFTLEASKNCKLLAVMFNIKNVSSKARRLDLKNERIIYQLTDKTNMVYNPMMTLLNNDIQYINLEVASGKTRQAVILFDVPKNIDTSNMKLTLTYEDKAAVIDLNE